jgi:uncharacterized membrane protein
VKSVASWIAAAVVLAALIHLGAVKAVPYAVMHVVRSKTALEPNRIHHRDPVTAASRDVVRPSPDLLYSACPYDVSERPLRITAPVPDTYFSIAAFAANTDNFFVINDAQMAAEPIAIVLLSEQADYQASAGERVVRAPMTEGVVLFRMLIEDRSRLDELTGLQRQADCRPVQ